MTRHPNRIDIDGQHTATSCITRRTALKAIGASAGFLTVGHATAGVPTPRLHTEGRWLRDPSGNEVQLRGMATADPGFYRRYHPKSFEEVLRRATDEQRGWHPNAVRLPITQDSVTHFGITTLIEEFIRPAVDLLASRDVYALVDFHLIRPYTQAATETYNQNNDPDLLPISDVMETFWDNVSPAFAGDEHVIFELFNEPTQPTMYGDDAGAWQTWRSAAQPWVDLVRSHAPETPIIIGSPRWTSVTHMAPEYPFSGTNLLYAGHIYPANGAPSSFDQYYGEPATDVPVVITEFGWDPNGGSVDQGTTSGWGQPFREWVEGYLNMGWISWCFDDSWAPTFFDSPQAGANEPWTLKDGSEQMGGYIKTWLEETKSDSIPEDTTDDTTAPPTPSNLRITHTTEISIELSWDAVTDDETGLSHYTLYVDGTANQEALPGITEATVGDLDPETAYEIGVSAEDDAGNESSQATVVAETIAADAEQSAHNGPHAVPGRIQAEDFDAGGQGIAYNDSTPSNHGGASYRDTGVDIGTAANSGYNVGYITDGEWLEYTIEVGSGGSFPARIHTAAGNGGGGIARIDIDGQTVATQNVWQTGSWSSWQTIRVGSVDLSAGEHIVRITAESGAWNFDWFEFGTDDSGGDTTAPAIPTNLTASAQQTSVALSWTAASDSGGSGLDHYAVSVDGTRTQTVPASTTQATVDGLSAGTTYEFGVSAIDGAGNASAEATVTATTDQESEPPTEALVVNDYDGAPAWADHRNDLGQWCGAGSFTNGGGTVENGALVLEYDNGGWFQEQINRDITEYESIVLGVRGANGGEETDIRFKMGGANALLADVTDSSISTSVSDVRIDLDAAGVDRTSSSLSVRLNFWQGGSSTLEIEQIRLE